MKILIVLCTSAEHDRKLSVVVTSGQHAGTEQDHGIVQQDAVAFLDSVQSLEDAGQRAEEMLVHAQPVRVVLLPGNCLCSPELRALHGRGKVGVQSQDRTNYSLPPSMLTFVPIASTASIHASLVNGQP
jgi:hypothetical protein